jgi:hypothetical protein
MVAPRPATTAPSLETPSIATPAALTTPSLEPPSIATPATPLRIASLDVIHLQLKPRGENGKSDHEVMGKLGKVPCQIRESDKVVVSAQFDAPAYSHLIALNPDGKDQLYLPPEMGQPRPASAEIGFDEFDFPLTDGSGLQAFVVVASRRPLPPYEQWPGRDGLRQRWKHVAADDVYDVWEYKDGQLKRLPSGARSPLEKHPGVESLAPFRNVCDYLRQLPDIEAVQAIAFPVRPKS